MNRSILIIFLDEDIKEYPKMMFNIANWNTVSLRVL